jgi:YHS domain-containing protein
MILIWYHYNEKEGKMKKILLVLLVLAALFMYSGAVYAQCALSGEGSKAVSKGEVCNSTCPVMGGEVAKDTPYKSEYKGKTIGFCCEGCVKAFEANPEKYTAKLGLENCDIEKS